MFFPVPGASATGSRQSGANKRAKTNPSSRGRGFFNRPYKQTQKCQLSTQRALLPLHAGPPAHERVGEQEESTTLVTNQHNILSVSPQQQPTAGAKHTKTRRAGELTGNRKKEWRMSEPYPHIAGSITANTTLYLQGVLDYNSNTMRSSRVGRRGKPHRRRAEMMQRQSANHRRDDDVGGL